MASHSITDEVADPDVTYDFALWRGDPPGMPTEQVTSYTRPGSDSIAQQKLGKRGTPIVAQLVSHFNGYSGAMGTVDDYLALPGKGLFVVVYNGIDWNSTYSIKFYVDAVRLLGCQAHPLIIGPTYAYANGAELITEWKLTPKDVS